MRALVVVVVALLLGAAGSASGRAPAPAPPGLAFTHVDRDHAQDSESVWIAAADGSHAREVAADAYGGELSADGRWLTYVLLDVRSYPLLMRDLATGKTRPLGTSEGAALRWARSGAQLAIARGATLVLIDAASGARTTLLRAHVSSFDFASDGKSIVLARSNGRTGSRERSDLFRLRLADRALVRLTDDGHSEGPRLSRHGLFFVRFKKETPAQEAWVMNTDGSHPRLLARCCLHRFEHHLAGEPLGFEVVAVSTSGTRIVLCQVSAHGCGSLAVDVPSGRRHWVTGGQALDLSADGRTILVVDGPFHDGPGRFRLFTVPFAGGQRTLLKVDAAEGRWRD